MSKKKPTTTSSNHAIVDVDPDEVLEVIRMIVKIFRDLRK